MGWYSLEEKFPDIMGELKKFLREHPTNMRITNGKAKKLRGKLQGIYQYDVSWSDRVRYEVEKRENVVKVLYAGPHP